MFRTNKSLNMKLFVVNLLSLKDIIQGEEL